MKSKLLAGMLAVSLISQAVTPFGTGVAYAEEKENISVENKEVDAAGANIVESGECGNEVWYTLDSNGLLTITSHQNQNQTQYTIDAHAFNGRTDIKKN